MLIAWRLDLIYIILQMLITLNVTTKYFCNENLKYGIFNLVPWPHCLKMFRLHKHILTPVILRMIFP